MVIRRIIWGLTVALSCLFYVFTASKIAASFIALCVLLPIISLIVAVITRVKISADIIIQSECIRGDTASGEVIINNSSKLFYVNARAVLKSENVKTNEISKLKMIIPAAPKSETSQGFELSAEHCGLTNVSFDSLYVLDYFRIFSFKVKSEGADSVIVLPQGFSTRVFVSSASAEGDSSEIIKTNTEYDTSDIIGIREYVPGDPVSTIHQKLSQKTDRLLVKEFGRTSVNKLLVVADAVMNGENYDKIDSVCEVFSGIMQSLIRDEINFSSGYRNAVINITRQREIDEILRGFLCAKNEKNVNPLDGININDYAKILFITADGKDFEDERIKVIKCSSDYENELSIIQI